MTVSVLKTEFVKSDPIQINYRNYKNCNQLEFSKHLNSELLKDATSNTNYDNLQSILIRVPNTHAPLKKGIFERQ